MPPRRRDTPPNTAAALQGRLSLLSWLHSRLGYADTREMLDDIKQAGEGFDADGHSYVYWRLKSREERLKGVSPQDLERYDDNIRDHLAAINSGRAQQRITLRYFQYLAALYAEIFLDRYTQSPAKLLVSINAFVDERNSHLRADEHFERFAVSDLNKLAFWMATGSGKTLLMHLNFRQFLHYNRAKLDNILLITPGEGLTQQHLGELETSRISARRFDLNESGLFANDPNTVRVTEITKLVLEKTGEGESIPVEAIEGNNLIFVDEGHKGTRIEGRRGDGTRTWRAVRDALGETGFTFEYSATFGQALTAARNDALTAEYGKAIAFDYSYRHFYGDGYGKDFYVLNLQQQTAVDDTDKLLLANLLSFYEQQLVYAEQGDALRPYNLDRPLWVFVGGSVNAVRTEHGRPTSDVLTVARFLHRALSDPQWATAQIRLLLDGESGLKDPDGADLFADKFPYLRGRENTDAAAVYQDILARTFHAPSAGGLHIAGIRDAKDELGLKASGSDDYFGLIYVGDTTKFKRLVESEAPGITLEEDAIAGSLFDNIARPDTTIETLIGARKFNEGWSSWRVSNMGLLNIGRSEGSQIIQLFGRGVRLRGRDISLKRTSALEDGDHPPHIGLLETLNIFAVRANYMAQFREYLEREGVATESPVELPLFIRPNPDFLNKGLLVPQVEEGRDFAAEAEIALEPDPEVGPVLVDFAAGARSFASANAGVSETAARSGGQTTIPADNLALVNWDRVYLELADYKERKGMRNLVIRPAELRQIVEGGEDAYTLIAEDSLVNPGGAEDWRRLEDAVVTILRKYADKLYRQRRERWLSENMVYKKLDKAHANFRFNFKEGDCAGRYVVSVPRADDELIRAIEELRADCERIYEREDRSGERGLSRIYFGRHIYQPLLLEQPDSVAVAPPGRVTVTPPGLNAGERQFVNDLRAYWAERQTETPDDTEVFLLRNQGRGAGVGFFETSGFYPDFILWIKTGERQRIVFIEPHGMIYANAPDHEEKVTLYKRLCDLARAISNRSGETQVSLDSYIISQTGFAILTKKYGGNMSREDFAERHILFPVRDGGYDYIERILRPQKPQ